MTLYFIGLGPSLDYLSLKAIEILRRVDKIYIDTYTSIVPGFSVEKLIEITGRDTKNIVLARRNDLEGEGIARIVSEAKEHDIAVLVPGDPFIATTHDAIRLEALEKGVNVAVVHGVSIHSLAASATGLQAYKFGKTVSLVYPREFKPYSTIEVIRDNLSRGLHTLVLLDLRLDEGIAMTINEAVDIMIRLEKEYCSSISNCRPVLEDTLGIACVQLGTDNQVVKADLLPKLRDYDYPSPPHSIIVAGDLHPVELELVRHIGRMPVSLYRYFRERRKHFVR